MLSLQGGLSHWQRSPTPSTIRAMRLPTASSSSSHSQPHPLLATAQQLAPRVAARSEEIEAARRLPADLAQELAQAGFFRMFIPEAYGGLELHPARIIEIVEE